MKSLNCKNIHCNFEDLIIRKKRTLSVKHPNSYLYAHEHNDSIRKTEGSEPNKSFENLSEISFQSSKTVRVDDPVESIRRGILQHLSGFTEGCAIFGLQQMFGSGKEFISKLELISQFVKRISESISEERLKSKRAKAKPSVSKENTARSGKKRKAKSAIECSEQKHKKDTQPKISDAAMLLLFLN